MIVIISVSVLLNREISVTINVSPFFKRRRILPSLRSLLIFLAADHLRHPTIDFHIPGLGESKNLILLI